VIGIVTSILDISGYPLISFYDGANRRLQTKPGNIMSETLIPTQGELAIRARHRAARAAAKRPESLNEAVSNQMDLALAKREARNLVKPPETLVTAYGEAVTSRRPRDVSLENRGEVISLRTVAAKGIQRWLHLPS
jgi:hypothetical protein